MAAARSAPPRLPAATYMQHSRVLAPGHFVIPQQVTIHHSQTFHMRACCHLECGSDTFHKASILATWAARNLNCSASYMIKAVRLGACAKCVEYYVLTGTSMLLGETQQLEGESMVLRWLEVIRDLLRVYVITTIRNSILAVSGVDDEQQLQKPQDRQGHKEET